MRTSLLSYKMPEISGPKTGTFAKIPEHEDAFNHRSFETSYRSSYNKEVPGYKSVKDIAARGEPACVSTNFKGKEQIKINTELISELYNEGKEPKYNTEVQRCWINTNDPGITAVKQFPGDRARGNKEQTVDNELSLPMEDNFGLVQEKRKGNINFKQSDITKEKLIVPDLRK